MVEKEEEKRNNEGQKPDKQITVTPVSPACPKNSICPSETVDSYVLYWIQRNSKNLGKRKRYMDSIEGGKNMAGT